MLEDFKIEKISDREIWIRDSRFYLGEDNILYVTAVGESDEKRALIEKKVALELVSKIEG